MPASPRCVPGCSMPFLCCAMDAARAPFAWACLHHRTLSVPLCHISVCVLFCVPRPSGEILFNIRSAPLQVYGQPAPDAGDGASIRGGGAASHIDRSSYGSRTGASSIQGSFTAGQSPGPATSAQQHLAAGAMSPSGAVGSPMGQGAAAGGGGRGSRRSSVETAVSGMWAEAAGGGRERTDGQGV